MFRDWVYPVYVKAMQPNIKRKRQGTERSQLIGPAAVLCAVLGLNTDTSLVYQLFAFLFCLLLIARFSLRFNKPQVSITRNLPRYVTADQTFEYHIAITNIGNHVESDLKIVDLPKVCPPSRNQFRDEMEPGEETRNAYDRFIGFHRFMYLQRLKTGIVIDQQDCPPIALKATINLTIHAEPKRRGIIHFARTKVLHPDPLNLNHGITLFSNPESLMVLPKRYRLAKSFSMNGGRNFQPGGINAAWSVGESDEFVSLRDYRDGDSMRKIHWASSAKRNKPVVKEYQDEFFVRQALILDTSSQNAEILEEAISVAASLILSMNQTDSMLDLIYLAKQPQILTSGRGTSSVNEQLEALATLTASPLPLASLAKIVIKHAKRVSGCLLVLCDWHEAHNEMINKLKASNIPLQIFIVTKDEQSIIGAPAHCHLLPIDEIQERLMQL